jgi:tetratricopeptide (TPR) repeat protein
MTMPEQWPRRNFAPVVGRDRAEDPLRNTFLELQQAESLRMQGQIEQARAICERLVASYPEYFGALYTLGLIYLDKEQYPQALGCLVRAAMLNPESWRALTALSAVYLELGASEMAAYTLERATAIEPEDPNILLTLGEIYREEREYELALDAYQRSYELDPSLEPAGLGLGTCQAHLGQNADAAKTFERLLKRGMSSLGAISELINLPTSFVSVDLTSELRKLKRSEQEDSATFENSISFVRASLLDREGRHREAWREIVSANQYQYLLNKQDYVELAETESANLALLKQRKIKRKPRAGRRSETISLFILGPSRSGKTTMESLVASLEGVKCGYENPCVENAIRRAFQAAGLLSTRMFEVLPPNLDSQCCELYLKELARRAGGAKVFTNTHPARIHDAARVAAAFPNVRFLFVKRNVEDNMLRIYMRRYLGGNPYAYHLKTIRDHIVWYHEMIDVLAEKLPDIVRVVHYEEMVADPDAALRVAAELCDLPMNVGPLPHVGDDRGCAEPYRDFIAQPVDDPA